MILFEKRINNPRMLNTFFKKSIIEKIPSYLKNTHQISEYLMGEKMHNANYVN